MATRAAANLFFFFHFFAVGKKITKIVGLVGGGGGGESKIRKKKKKKKVPFGTNILLWTGNKLFFKGGLIFASRSPKGCFIHVELHPITRAITTDADILWEPFPSLNIPILVDNNLSRRGNRIVCNVSKCCSIQMCASTNVC